jgi:phosphatidate cytidylyltransferase
LPADEQALGLGASPGSGMTRVLSALLLIPIVLAVVWFLPPVATLLLASLAAAIAVMEYCALAKALNIDVQRAIAPVPTIAACIAVGDGSIPLVAILLLTLLAIGIVAVVKGQPGPGVLAGVAATAFALLYIGAPLGAIAAIRTIGGREAVLLLIATIIVSDSAQYYTGRAFGRAPLAPSISPKKTREGAVGGVVFGTAAMIAGGRLVFPASSLTLLAVTGLVVVLFGIAGDLFESLLKRSAGVKDSSGLIPGHGGILDRIDSWLFAGPAYYLFLRYLQS